MILRLIVLHLLLVFTIKHIYNIPSPLRERGADHMTAGRLDTIPPNKVFSKT